MLNAYFSFTSHSNTFQLGIYNLHFVLKYIINIFVLSGCVKINQSTHYRNSILVSQRHFSCGCDRRMGLGNVETYAERCWSIHVKWTLAMCQMVMACVGDSQIIVQENITETHSQNGLKSIGRNLGNEVNLKEDGSPLPDLAWAGRASSYTHLRCAGDTGTYLINDIITV